MKIAICYPPFKSDKGIPLLTQNRQFQWFSDPCYIYPMVPAYLATTLKELGHEVFWLDGIAQKKTEEEYLKELQEINPDVIFLESKTPVIKRHWRFIDEIKKLSRAESRDPKSEIRNTKIVLVGDHVTAMPEETMKNSKVDFVLTGGDYDFLFVNLVKNLQIKSEIRNPKSETNHKFKILNPKQLEPGIWYRDGKTIKNTGQFVQNHDLNTLPLIDRDLTQWKLYAYDNGNYKQKPGTYTMSGRDCFWGKCSFCSWTTLYPQFRTMKPEKLLAEVKNVVENYGVKEIMDDSGCFPAGGWLENFCKLMIKSGLNKKVKIDCNMRVNALNVNQYRLMAKAGFRFILYGLESASQNTLDRINKNIKVEDIEKAAAMAKNAGLAPHMTCMIGYPWEKMEDAKKTIALTKTLFDKGYIDTLQATIVIPYPGTPLFAYCKKNKLLKTLNWDEYDMRRPIMKSPISDAQVKELTQDIYKSFLTPKFILRKILSIRSFDDIKFFAGAARRVFGHLTDFGKKKK